MPKTTLACVFIAGAVVMVIEILGTRVIGPAFGVGLFVWAALLSTTLTALAIGYYVGGILADRSGGRTTPAPACVAGGALLGIAMVVHRPVVGLSQHLGIRMGPLVAAAVLFGPALVALATIGPIAVRNHAATVERTGHRVGGLYALSTFGSLVGTLLTAFVLIPNFSTNAIAQGAAVVLLATGAACWAARRWMSAALAVVFLVVGLTYGPGKLPAGLSVVDRADSLYGRVRVIDDRNRGMRLLFSDHSILGGETLNDRLSVFGFVYVLQATHFIRPAAVTALQVGLGTGAAPTALAAMGVRSDVVEIDPAVVRMAREHFAYRPNGEVFIEDARALLERTQRRYDIVIHDTFTGGATPEHLLSKEVFDNIRRILNPGGLLALNFPGYSTGPAAKAGAAVAHTLRQTFKHVRCFRDEPPDVERGGAANLIYFASDSPVDVSNPASALERLPEPARRTIGAFAKWEVDFDSAGPATTITDGYNPLLTLQLPVQQEHFVAMRELFPDAVWID